jgi:hypothetical protein
MTQTFSIETITLDIDKVGARQRKCFSSVFSSLATMLARVINLKNYESLLWMFNKNRIVFRTVVSYREMRKEESSNALNISNDSAENIKQT